MEEEEAKYNGEVLTVHSFAEREFPAESPFVVEVYPKMDNAETIEEQIKRLARQREDRFDDEDKRREVAMNTLKNRAQKRSNRAMDKATPFHKLSASYQELKLYAAYLPIYEERRRREFYTMVIDLGVMNLQEVIFNCFREGIIDVKQLRQIKDRSVQKEMDYVRKFSENRLHDFDFSSAILTPLHYRKLREMLISHSPKYILGESIYSVFKELTDFQRSVERIPEKEYFRLCYAIDRKHNLDVFDFLKGYYNREYELQMDAIDGLNIGDTSVYHRPSPTALLTREVDEGHPSFFSSKVKIEKSDTRNDENGKKSSKNGNEDKSESEDSENSESDEMLDSFISDEPFADEGECEEESENESEEISENSDDSLDEFAEHQTQRKLKSKNPEKGKSERNAKSKMRLKETKSQNQSRNFVGLKSDAMGNSENENSENSENIENENSENENSVNNENDNDNEHSLSDIDVEELGVSNHNKNSDDESMFHSKMSKVVKKKSAVKKAKKL